MTTLEILRAARAIIAQPGRWCQGEMARDVNGCDTSPLAADACQFCAVGALIKASGKHRVTDIVMELRKTAGTHVVEYNDPTDLPAVLAMFDATIARMGSQGESR